MFVEVNQKIRIPLEIGQLYLLGKQTNGLGNKSKHFIELEAEEEIEPKHCVIDVGHSEDVYVYDLFNLKATLLNDKPLKGLEKTRLQNGDILKVGKQEIKYCHEQPEVSHDSSGFLEVNKNTSDIIASSPDSTSQTESRLKRHNYNNFLVPSIPPRKSTTPNTSVVIPETEAINISRNSLNASSTSITSNNRRSESFTIPETQYCKARLSLNASDLSVAESIPDDNGNKIKFNFGNLDLDDDDDFCIPETQEVLPSSQRPRLLSNAKEKSILVEESSSANDDDVMDGSQFRICTQDYNEGFGEEAEAMQSQIIPLIKHNTVILNDSSNKSKNESGNTSSKSNSESLKNQNNLSAEVEEDKELSAVKWSNSRNDQETTELRADCSTPDIFEFADNEQPEEAKEKEKDKVLVEAVAMDEDEEDLMPTQVFPLSNSKTVEKKTLQEQDKPCLDKEPEEVLTLSDKENRCPITLEPITDLPPTQLFATNEVSSSRSTTSTSSRNSVNTGLKITAQPLPENKNNPKSIINLDLEDEEDDLLTQAFVQPSHPTTSNTSNNSNKTTTNKCFNSTVLEDKLAKNPHTFFAEMEKTPLKQNPTSSATNIFKLPDKEISVVKKTSSAASTISENDLDLLMCTPQFIKDHMFVDKNEDLRKNILAAKNRNLFGEDPDEDTNDDKKNEEDDDDLVKLINVPKDTLDFEKLLPHLNKKSPSSSQVKKEENAAKEANKMHKFNLSFGKEQDEKRKSISKSSTLSRDERHSARDKERELAENNSNSHNRRRGRKPKVTDQNTNTSAKDADNEKPVVSREHRKRHAKDDKSTENTKVTKLEENVKKEDSKKQKSSNKEERNRLEKNDKTQESSKEVNLEENNRKEDEHKQEVRKRHTRAAKTSESSKESKVEEKPKEMPARRMTRAKSRADDSSTTSKESNAKSKQRVETDEGDELDSIATQPFVVRLPRRCSTAKQSESQSSIASNSSRKSNHGNQSKHNSSTSHNNSANSSIISKTNGERKRKAEPTAPVVPAKVERKRLRSTHSQESATSSYTTTNSTSTSSAKILISMTMVDHELFKGLAENSKGIWHLSKDPAESEILVMDKAFRTFKFLLAMARGIPIVTSEYLKKLNQAQSLRKVKITDYLFKDEAFEKKHKCSLIESQQKAKKHKLFRDYEFVMTANILPNPKEIKAIIEASGGFVHPKAPPGPKENQHLYLITSKEDRKEWQKYRRLNDNIIIVSTEAIMSAIMRQSCESLKNYTLA